MKLLPLRKSQVGKKQNPCEQKCHRKPMAENRHYKTAGPGEINTRGGAAEESENRKELLNEENSKQGHESKYRKHTYNTKNSK